MVITLGDHFLAHRSPEEVFDFLVDPARFCPLLPEFQSFETVDEKHFTVKVRVGVSHIRGTATVRLALAAAERPRSASYEGGGDVPGGTATVRASFDLQNATEGTDVIWKGEATIVGRLPSIAGGMLEPLARKSLQKLIVALQSALAQPVTQIGQIPGREADNDAPPGIKSAS
jgi:carbon monoxide dehydrogenase subunit G